MVDYVRKKVAASPAVALYFNKVYLSITGFQAVLGNLGLRFLGPLVRKRVSLSPSQRKIIVGSGDVLLSVTAMMAAFALWFGRQEHSVDGLFWFLLPAGWLFTGIILGLYHHEMIVSFQRSFGTLLKCLLVVTVMYFFLYFFAPPKTLPRGVFVYHTVLSFIFLSGWRFLFLSVTNGYMLKRRCVILGDEDEVETVASFLKSYPFFEVVRRREVRDGIKSMKKDGEFLSLLKSHQVDEIVIGETARLPLKSRGPLLGARERGVALTPVSMIYENLTTRVPVDFLGKRGWPLILIGSTAKDRELYFLAKRLFDVVGAALGLVSFGLILPFLALAVRLESSGPIFYGQDRVGKGGMPFTVWKLRTMVPNAEKEEDLWSKHNDSRVTRVGRWLRKFRLDEFPQCWNILKGEMSIVGPRPERVKVVQELEKKFPFYRLRHIAKPGMAGWAMVNRGHMCSFDDAKIRLEYDLYYIKQQSFWFDVLIILRAIEQLILMKGK